MPTLDDLRLRTGQLVTEDWYDDLVDYLEQIGYGGIITLYGYAQKDIIPAIDLLLNLGIPIRRWLAIHCGYGYFSGNAWIDGHVVLKDGDPITVSDFGASAEADIKTRVQEALDASTDVEAIKTNTENIQTKVQNALDASADVETIKTKTTNIADLLFKPTLLSSVIETSKPANTDLFTPDLVALYAGRIRVKFTSSYYVYLFMRHKATGQGVTVMAMLNAGIALTPDAWYEWDFTNITSDAVNLRINPQSTITVFVYNIPNT